MAHVTLNDEVHLNMHEIFFIILSNRNRQRPETRKALLFYFFRSFVIFSYIQLRNVRHKVSVNERFFFVFFWHKAESEKQNSKKAKIVQKSCS